MLRRFLPVAVIVLLIALFAGFLWIGASSRSYKQCRADYQSEQQQAKPDNAAPEPRVDLFGFFVCEAHFADENNALISAAAAVVIATFTVVLAYSTHRQARLTREAIELGNREFVTTHRPKIRVAYIQLTALQAGEPPAAEIWALNAGDSDAQITELGVDIFARRLGEAGISEFSDEPHPYPDRPVVKPGQQANLQARGSAPLTQEIIAGLRPTVAGGPAAIQLCIIGAIDYLDANGMGRLTSFFRVYRPERNRFLRPREDDEYAEWDYEA